MSVDDVCRLCLSKDNLIWVFDKTFNNVDNMRDVIFITTGVEIFSKDVISQKICSKCSQISVKMLQFRNHSLKNDQYLKEQYNKMLEKTKIGCKILNTTVKMKAETKVELKQVLNQVISKVTTEEETNKEAVKMSLKRHTSRSETKEEKTNENKHEVKSDTPKTKPTKTIIKYDNKPEIKTHRKIHPSINDLFKMYPQIMLPSSCLTSNMSPRVSMEMDAVEKYLEKQQIGRERNNKQPQSAVARKKTSALPGTKHNSTLCDKEKETCSAIVDGNAKTVEHDERNKRMRQAKHPVLVGQRPSYDDSDDMTKTIVKTRKRKLSDSAFLEPSELQKPTRTPNNLCLGKTVPLYLCNICNSIQYNNRDLKRHQLKHLVCQFCKARFKTMKLKEQHLENNCLIKNMMRHLPIVKLEYVELNARIRREYPAAFQKHFAVLEGTVRREVESMPIEVDLTGVEPGSAKSEGVISSNNNEPVAPSIESQHSAVNAEQNCSNDIIEILSDDEDSIPAPPEKDQVLPTHNTVVPTQSRVTLPLVQNQLATEVSSVALSDVQTKPVTPASTLENEPVSVSVVRPDLKIRNNVVLDTIDPKLTDLKVAKELLSKCTLLLMKIDRATQTNKPNNKSIVVNQVNGTTELKNLKSLLLAYKIPIVIKKGNFHVEYVNSAKSQTKKMSLWHDLTPVDVKVVDTPAQNGVDATGSRSVTVSVVSNSVATPITESLNHQMLENMNFTPEASSSERVGNNLDTSVDHNYSNISNNSDVISPPNVNLIGSNTAHSVIHPNSVINTSHVGSSHSEHSSSVTQKNVVSKDTVPITSSEPVKSGTVMGTIRVKNVWELT